MLKEYEEKLGETYSLYNEKTGEIIRGDKFMNHKSGDGSYFNMYMKNFIKQNSNDKVKDIIKIVGENYYGCLSYLILNMCWNNEINPKILLTNGYMKKSKYYNFMKIMYEYNIIYKQELEYETKYYINPNIAVKGRAVKIELYNMFKDGYNWSEGSNFKTKE